MAKSPEPYGQFLARIAHMGDRPKAPAARAPASGRLNDEAYRAAAREIVAIGEAREPEHASPAYDEVFGSGRNSLFESEERHPEPGDRLFGASDGDRVFGDAPMPSPPDSEAVYSDRLQESATPDTPDASYNSLFGPAE
jgi:hypothetical protein